MKKTLILILLLIAAQSITYSQTVKVRAYLQMVAQGNIEEVKKEMPDLLAEFPNDPGVQLLHAVVLDAADRALEIYQFIVQNHSSSEWADDAYWRIIQYHAVLGDTTNARSYLNLFRKQFPASEFLMPATDVVRSAVGLARKGAIGEEQMDAGDNKIDFDEQAEIDSSKTYFGLQVGVFKNKEYAVTEVEKFQKQRMNATIVEKNVADETLYAVLIGNYSSRESAEAAKSIVDRQCNCNSIILEKKFQSNLKD